MGSRVSTSRDEWGTACNPTNAANAGHGWYAWYAWYGLARHDAATDVDAVGAHIVAGVVVAKTFVTTSTRAVTVPATAMVLLVVLVAEQCPARSPVGEEPGCPCQNPRRMSYNNIIKYYNKGTVLKIFKMGVLLNQVKHTNLNINSPF